MCLAVVGVLGAVVSAVGSLVGGMAAAAGAQQKAQAEAQAAQYQAAVARNNATAEAYKGAEKSQDIAIKGDYALANQRAAFAGAGVQVGTGTPITVFGQSAGRIQGDVQQAQYGGRIEAQRWQDQATLDEMQAINAKKAGDIAAQGAIIGGITGAAGSIVKGGGGAGQSLSLFS
jgi:type II secretory pathway pseudopilin PulG